MKKDIISFYSYRIFSRFYFHVPVLFVFFYLKKLSIIEIELMLAIYGLVLMVAPKLIGGIKKTYKRKYTIIIGEVIKALGLVCFINGSSFAILIIGQVLSGLGYSFTAGTDSVLLKSVFKKYGEGNENPYNYKYKKVESNSNSYMFIAFLIAGILGSIVFNWKQEYAFYLSILSNIISIISMLVISEDKEAEPAKDNTNTTDKKDSSIMDEKLKKEISFWKSYYSISRAFTLGSFVGFLPYFFFIVTDVNMYYFGLILSVFNLTGFIASRVILNLSNKIGYKKLTIITLILLAIALLIFGIFSSIIIGVAAITLLGIASGGVRPLTLSHLNTLDLSSSERMKIISSMEQQYGFWNALLLILGGVVLNSYGFNKLMIGFAGVYLIIVLSLYIKHIQKGSKSVYESMSSDI